MRNLSMLALVVIGLFACRGGDDSGDDQPMPDGSTTNPNDVTIQEIQNDAMPECNPADPATCVELKLKGVVVTAVDTFGDRKGDFWIGEPGGGPYSGVQVYGAPLDQVAALQIGDVVDIAGAQKSEFALTSDTSGNRLTELEPVEGGMMSVTKTGASMPIEPTAVDALTIGQMPDFMARAAEWEKWEGVLVKLTNVEAFSNTTCITSMGNCTDMTYERFDITGDIQVQSSLAAMPATKVARGDCLSGITGVMGYFFDYQILPRTTAEIGTGGTACPVENTATTCGDGIDNNGNGFKDCGDFSCQQAVPACSVATTVAAIQMGTSTGAVVIDEAFVIARDEIGTSSKGLWVADALQGAQYNGIYVLTGSTAPAANLVPGAKVKVQGTVSEFDTGNPQMGDKLTEITNATLTFVSAPAGLPTPLTGVAITTLTDIAAPGEPYEGVLVQLSTLKVTNNALGFGKVELTDNNGAKIVMDDDAFAYAMSPNVIPANNTCFATLTGIMGVQLIDDIRTINPRAATDMVVGTGCN
jgi:hypothetical protein